MRALLDLVGEGCCCCCDKEGEPATRSRTGVPSLAGHLPLSPPGRTAQTGRLEMPPLKLRPVLDESFVPPVPSWDSPQRPGAWGAGFIPGVLDGPSPRVFTHERVGEADPLPDSGPFFPPTFQRPDGTSVALPGGPLRVRVGEGALAVDLTPRTLYPAGWAYAYDPYGPYQLGVYHPRGDIQPTPDALSPFGALPGLLVPPPGATLPLTFPAIRFRTGARGSETAAPLLEWERLPDAALFLSTGEEWPAFDAIGTRWRERVVVGTWPEVPAQGPEIVTERRGPITRGVLQARANDPGSGDVTSLQVYREERPSAEGGTRYWTVGVTGTEWVEGAEWQVGVVLQLRTSGDPYPWHDYSCSWVNSMPRETVPPPELPWSERTWATPDGQVTWTPGTATQAGTLSAYGHTLAGGTWAGLSPPVTPGGALPDPGQAVVLHERGGTVTALWPGGRRESGTRAAFEAGGLRCAAGAFRQFSPVGLGSNVWPPQWAWAVTGEDEARALTAWDAWRDSTPREWPGRPKRRPPPGHALSPPAALRPPLGVTLATTGRVPRGEEPLKARDGRRQPPWQVPATVEVQGEGWTPSAAALAALAKPMLYPPGGQEERLDDTTSARGTLRVTWAGERLPDGGTRRELRAALLFRAKVPAGQLPTLTVNGLAATVRPLGRNAGTRGWHPYLATWGALYAPVAASPLTLTCSAPMTRLLLARIGLGETGGGVEG
ncbi:hypothetical protein DEIPH_ctg052orf0005 [Deinococcus phoenicis]|uniref:Uncharacterized protein n=2 Tax=Deinococcus phoenicis TaxID=1476583 RepID=A0A016QLT5_9DEIO|nr:hypothetical protein DEIPH_ctg052orf0005 [Deinococcus phoenicis]